MWDENCWSRWWILAWPQGERMVGNEKERKKWEQRQEKGKCVVLDQEEKKRQESEMGQEQRKESQS